MKIKKNLKKRLSKKKGLSRAPKRRVALNRRLLQQLGVLSRGLVDGLRGEISTIESIPGRVSGIFAENGSGPLAVFSHVDAPTREDATELAADFRQVYGEGLENGPPRTVILHVQKGDEDAARETARELADQLSEGREDGRRYVLVEQGTDAPDDRTVGVVFALDEVEGSVTREDTGNRELTEEDSSGDSRRNESPPQAPPRTPPQSAPPQQPAPPPDPDADMRRVVPLVPLTPIEAFRQATREIGLGGRSAEYERVANSLEAYHREVANYVKEAQVVKGEITAVGVEKSNRIRNLIDMQTRRKRLIEGNLDTGVRATRLLGEISVLRTQRDQAADDTERGRLNDEIRRKEQESENLLLAVRNDREAISRLDRDIEGEATTIGDLDKRLSRAFQLNRQVIRRYENALASRGDELIRNAKGYLDSKTLSATDSKQAAVRDLLQQASDPEQHLQRLKEATKAVWNADFPNLLAAPARLLNTGTASEVFLAETNGELGATGSRFGYAKKGMAKGDEPNATTTNLGIPVSIRDGSLEQNPNLIARQVVSSRLNRELGLTVIADEVFSADTDGKVLGVTAKAPGKQARRNQEVPLLLRETDGNGAPTFEDTAFVFPHFNLSDARIQKNLSDLQVMDALTGQLDRHIGNIFIDDATGAVTGIDNDMAFALDSASTRTSNTLLTFKREENGDLVYLQDQIDRGTAEKILAMTPEKLGEIIRGREGDPERMTGEEGDAAVRFAVERLNAMKARIRQLDGLGRLIGGPNDARQWGGTTFDEGIENGTARDGRRDVDLNYLARLKNAYEAAGRGNNPLMLQEGQGG